MSQLEAQEKDNKKRLDVFLVEHLPVLSRAFIQKLCDQGKVLVNGSIKKTGYKLKGLDKVSLDYDLADLDKIPMIDLPVIYEDDDCVVINKPTGVLAHSKGAFNPEATVASWLSHKIKSNGWKRDNITLDFQRSGIVHRLDRATSGVMVCAKTPEAMTWLQKQFSNRNVKKTYLAVISGKLDPQSALIDMPIERNPKKPQTFRVGSNGKPAHTAYQTIFANGKRSILILSPTTGRTHQLRVHLKHLGHPIVGDTFYGGEVADRLFLHAQTLEITLPNRQRKVFEVPEPKEFKQFRKV